MDPKRKQIQEVYIRVCRDSGFQLDFEAAAKIAAGVLKISPLEIWIAIPDLGRMKAIAAGTDPVLKIDKP